MRIATSARHAQDAQMKQRAGAVREEKVGVGEGRAGVDPAAMRAGVI